MTQNIWSEAEQLLKFSVTTHPLIDQIT